MVTSLINEGVLPNDKHTHSVLEKWQNRLESQLPQRMGILGAFIYTVALALSFSVFPLVDRSQWWLGSHLALPWLMAPLIFIFAYALLMVLADLAIAIIYLIQLLENEKLIVKPLNSDEAGGFGAIDHFSTSLVYIVLLLGGGLSLAAIIEPSRLQSDYFIRIGLVVYVIGTLTYYYFLLRPTHQKMALYRNKIIKKISSQYENEVEETLPRGPENTVFDWDSFNRVVQLGSFWQVLQDFPVWPISRSNRRWLTGIIVIVIIPVLVTFLDNWLTN